MVVKILQIGAEALILLQGKKIIKKRVQKSYRIPEIDEKIRKLRTRSESKLIEKASKIIHTPELLGIDEKNKEIVINYINGKKLSDNLDFFSLKKQKEICFMIGKSIAKLHNSNIIHGDLTTSNMIFVKNKEKKIFFVDFGLGFISHKIEDKAVDLHLLKEALEARHFKNWMILFDCVLKGYSTLKNHKEVIERLNRVERRGRYKAQY